MLNVSAGRLACPRRSTCTSAPRWSRTYRCIRPPAAGFRSRRLRGGRGARPTRRPARAISTGASSSKSARTSGMGGREWEVFLLVWGICTWVRDGEQHSPCETVGGRDRCVQACVGVYSRQDKQRGGTAEKARKYGEFQRLLASGAGGRVASGTASTAERHRVAEAPIPRRVVSREHCSRALFPSTAGTSSSARCTRHRPNTIASTRLWAGTWSATWRRSGGVATRRFC